MDKRDYSFIKESSNSQKLRIFFFSLFILIIFIIGITLFYRFFKEPIDKSAPLEAFKSFIDREVKNLTPIGMFYISFTGSLFFLFAPIEIFFLLSLEKGAPILILLFFTLAGIIPAHLINYFIGLKFGNPILNFMSKKKVYKLRRKINKYGIYAILLFNMLPLPSDLLTFGLGITKYNTARLFLFLIIGNLIKLGFIILLFSGLLK